MLLGIVLVPSVCVFWFMDQAVQNERFALRQKLVDAYRAHLVLGQEHLQTHWRQFAADLEAQANGMAAPAVFAKQVRTGAAEAVVCFDETGKVAYPDTPMAAPVEKADGGLAAARDLEAGDPAAAALAYARLAGQAGDADLAARAIQGEVRCRLATGDRPAAIARLTSAIADERYRDVTDARGRRFLPNAELMAIELLRESAPQEARAIRSRLRTRLLDYESERTAAPQRRFLLRELHKLSPETAEWPALAAEDLAAQWLAAVGPETLDSVVRPTPVAGVWQFASRGGRILTLHRTDSLIKRLRSAFAPADLPADIRIDLLPPGQESEGALLSLPVGAIMPGWRLALALRDQRQFDTATAARARAYGWISFLVIATVAALALLAWGLVRRQMALTQLRNDLVANVTHELKTPLSSTRLFVETLMNTSQLHEPTVREYLQLIAQENLRLSRLIDNFLTFSRIERNRYAFTFAEASAGAIAERAAAAVRERFQAPQCQLDVTIAPNLPAMRADADALVTALVNLLDNAWKYSGEVKQVALAVGAQNDRVVFSVRDNGIGLSQREAKRIFQRFYQVKQDRSPASSGCGLGLSIVQFIVAAHHGTVSVESEPRKGSTFVISLPAGGRGAISETKP